jgi:hypothetical protein
LFGLAQVTFNYVDPHNVYIHPSGDCTEDDKILVGATGAGSATYTFKSSDAGADVTFACDFSAHCEAGQIITFSIGRSWPSVSD